MSCQHAQHPPWSEGCWVLWSSRAKPSPCSLQGMGSGVPLTPPSRQGGMWGQGDSQGLPRAHSLPRPAPCTLAVLVGCPRPACVALCGCSPTSTRAGSQPWPPHLRHVSPVSFCPPRARDAIGQHGQGWRARMHLVTEVSRSKGVPGLRRVVVVPRSREMSTHDGPGTLEFGVAF